MSDTTFDEGSCDGLLERLFGAWRLKRSWHVLVPANDDVAADDLHPAYIEALLKRRRTW